MCLFSPFGARFRLAGEPELPEREEEDDQLDETEEQRRARLVEEDQELARLRVKQEAFDSAVNPHMHACMHAAHISTHTHGPPRLVCFSYSHRFSRLACAVDFV